MIVPLHHFVCPGIQAWLHHSMQHTKVPFVPMENTRFLKELGAKIKEFRLKKGISQTQLAFLCEFEKASMSRIESGFTNITVLNLKKISDALEVNVMELMCS
jgi:DNA-binding Xre family transcriptional regulator